MAAYFPRISPDGQHVVAGNGHLELDGQDLKIVGWGPCWLTNDTILFNNGTVAATITLVDRTPKLKLVGYSELDAQGGGKWAGFTTTSPLRVDVSDGTTIQGAGSPSVSKAGHLAYVHPRQEMVKSVYLDGQKVSTDTAIAEAKVSDTLLVWTTPGKLFFKALPNGPVTQQPLSNISLFRPVPIDTPQGPWIQCHTQKGIVLFPAGSTQGHYHNTNEQSYYPDALYANGAIQSAYTDVKGNLFRETFPLTPSTDLTTIRETTVPAPTPFPNPVWSGWFYSDSIRYGSTPNVPANCTVVVEPGLKPLKPVIIPVKLIPEFKDRWSNVLAIYVTDEDGPLADQVKAAKTAMSSLGEKPIMSYTSRRIADADGISWVGVECYINPGETPTKAAETWKGLMTKTTKPVVLVIGAYDKRTDKPNLTVPEMVEGVYRAAVLAHDPRVKAMLYFAWARPGGGKDYPEVAAAVAAVFKGVKPPPVPLPSPPSNTEQISCKKSPRPV